MFKRVEKKRKRKEEEQKLGLDEELKEALGIQETDSEESDSDTEKNSDDEEASDDELPILHVDEDGEDEEEEEEEQEELNSDEEKEEEKPPIPIHSALLDPLYIISLDPQVTKACLVCPGKVLKGKDMFEIHKSSKAHSRRFKKFSEKAATAEPESDAWIIVDQINEKQPGFAGTDGLSKRAQKRKAHSAAIKERHAKRKAAAKAKKEAQSKADTSTPVAGSKPSTTSKMESLPSKKKRKVTSGAEVISKSAARSPREKSDSRVGKAAPSVPLSRPTIKSKAGGEKKKKRPKQISVT